MATSEHEPGTERPFLVERARDLEELAEHVEACDVVALDVEADSLYAYREQTCIVQVTAGHESAIIDPLTLEDLSPLRDAVDRPDVEVVFHGGDYDIAMLSRDHDFRFHRVFDTMIAATLLGVEKIGLANLVLEAFDIQLDKRFQTVDWSKRPLSDEQIVYLHRDTAYLPALRTQLLERLAEEDLLEEAEIEFRHLATREGKPATFDPEGWRRMKGVGRLGDRERAVLQRLFVWRDTEARRRDVPPFKVLSPRFLMDLSGAEIPASGNPRDLSTLPPRLRQRYGRQILKAMREGERDAQEGHSPLRDRSPRLSAEERRQRRNDRDVEDALRKWRKAEAAERKVPNIVVLPNRALSWLIRQDPRSIDELAECSDIGPKRQERYGSEVLDVLERARR